METSRLIGGKEPHAIWDVTGGGLVVSPNAKSRRAQALRALLAASPDAGTNTLIVSHKPSSVDALGKDWFEVSEGEAPMRRSFTSTTLRIALDSDRAVSYSGGRRDHGEVVNRLPPLGGPHGSRIAEAPTRPQGGRPGLCAS